jgi:hypothetical protein
MLSMNMRYFCFKTYISDRAGAEEAAADLKLLLES